MNAAPFVERRVVRQRLMAKLPNRPDHDGQRRMPHEHDESADTTNPEPDDQMRQGKRDLDRGLEDTSRAKESDQAYRRLKK